MERGSADPISAAADVFGDRWTLLILRDIVCEDRRNFRTLLLGSPEGIASNILADRLVRLVEAGLLKRGEGRRGQRVTYSLTEAGIDAVLVLQQLADWGARWRRPDGGPPDAGGATAERRRSLAEGIDDLRQRHLGAGPA